METVKSGENSGAAGTTCAKTPPSFFQRYKGFFVSRGTMITAANTLLMVLGFVAGLLGQPTAAKWLYLASAVIGGAPIFKLAAGNIIRSFDLTAGVMVSIAMIAALIVGEYSAAALVAFMMLVGEMLEDFTVARADNALNELESLVPAIVTLRRQDRDEEVPIELVRPGDLVVVRPGERIGRQSARRSRLCRHAVHGRLAGRYGRSRGAGNHTGQHDRTGQASFKHTSAGAARGEQVRPVSDADGAVDRRRHFFSDPGHNPVDHGLDRDLPLLAGPGHPDGDRGRNRQCRPARRAGQKRPGYGTDRQGGHCRL
jgi:hypothetical protein